MRKLFFKVLMVCGLVKMIIGGLVFLDKFFLGFGNVWGGGFIASVGWILLE